MKRIIFLIITVIFLSNVFTACNFMDTDSDLIKFEEDYKLKNPTDTLYSMFGILSNVQKLADSYVLLGELRADLMDVTENSRQELLDIYNWDIKPTSKYAQVKDYYAIINNCNYVINNIDTSYVSKGTKVLMKEFVGAKSIRAWTYMQLALNFKTAIYYTNPILTTDDVKADYPTVTLDELAPLLIEDLLPYANEVLPRLGNLGTKSMTYSFFPVKMLLGDLYLWSGQYQEAASMYASLIKQRKYLIGDIYKFYWVASGGVLTGVPMWIKTSNKSDIIGAIINSTEYDTPSEIRNMSYPLEYDFVNPDATYEIRPSLNAMTNWYNTLYYNDGYEISCDIRFANACTSTTSLSILTTPTNNNGAFILKFSPSRDFSVALSEEVTSITIYRTPLLYLRYAEAVNRLKKPNLAFAVIKNGLSNATLASRKIIPKNEITSPISSYMDFTNTVFDDNIGTGMIGQAVKTLTGTNYIDVRKAATDTTFVIPTFASIEDSMNYVEDLIIDELALETAFEGNRFQDLMRVAKRRNSPEYLADRVFEKYKDNNADIRSKLLVEANWYLPSNSVK